jgi:hypothetical protein
MVERTVELRSGQEIIFESGCLVLASPGAFVATESSLFSARGLSDLWISGYGATLRMRKRDYQKTPYAVSEWRHVFALEGVSRTLIEGLAIESSGGDGVYIGTLAGETERRECVDLTLRDLRIVDNHRQGISLISWTGILIEHCTIARTNGTLPMAGIDFEPNGEDPGFYGCVVRNCRIEGNSGPGILFAFGRLMPVSVTESITVETCLIRNQPVAIGVLGSRTGNRINVFFSGCSLTGLRYIQRAPGLTVRLR